MRRSLILSFITAVVLHLLFALVELKAFKIDPSHKISPKVLTMKVVLPEPAIETPVEKHHPIAAKEIIRKRNITEKVKSKHVVEPKPAEKRKVQAKSSVAKEPLPVKDESVDDFLYPDSSEIKNKEDDFCEQYTFVGDMVDIPRALPNITNIPRRKEKDKDSDSRSDIPIINAHPIYKSNTSPPYPLLARKRGYEGTVFLEVLVGTDGKAASITIVRSSGYKILDKAAKKGVRGWLFHPAKRGDELIEMWVKIPVRFSLN